MSLAGKLPRLTVNGELSLFFSVPWVGDVIFGFAVVGVETLSSFVSVVVIDVGVVPFKFAPSFGWVVPSSPVHVQIHVCQLFISQK